MTQNVVVKFGAILFVICLISSGLLSGAYTLTKPRIDEQKAAAQREALSDVMPQAKGGFEEVTKEGKVLYYRGYLDGDPLGYNPLGYRKKNLVGYVFKTDAKGYSSKIEILGGVAPDGKITGIKILSHEETPGLGARVDETLSKETLWQRLTRKTVAEKREPWFCKQFRGKTIYGLAIVKGKVEAVTGASPTGIEAITGATITSEAVTMAVQNKAREILKK